MNLIGRFGTRLQYRHCCSESHLIRDCRTAPEVGLVRYVCDKDPDEALGISPREMLDVVQSMKDEEYAVLFAIAELSEPQDPEPSKILFLNTY